MMFDEMKAKAEPELTPGELVNKLYELRQERSHLREAQDVTQKRIEEAEAMISRAIAFLKDAVDLK
jgi:hypothetical protein